MNKLYVDFAALCFTTKQLPWHLVLYKHILSIIFFFHQGLLYNNWQWDKWDNNMINYIKKQLDMIKKLGFIIKFLIKNRFYIKQMYTFFKREERAILNISKYGDNNNLYVKTETRHPPEVIDKISPGVKEDNTKFADEIVKEIVKD